MGTEGLKVYVASRLENAAAVRVMYAVLHDAGLQVAYDWTRDGDVRGRGVMARREVSEKEIRAVRESDALVLLCPGGRGAHVELGAALALGIAVVVVGPIDGLSDPAFYSHPRVARVADAPQAVAFLLGLAAARGADR